MVRVDILEKLKKLFDELVSEGCNNFYIYGINKSVPEDVVCLNNDGGKWEIYYTERGIKGEIIYSTVDLNEAINYYRNYIKKITHLHIICFTRYNEIMNNYKKILVNNKIEIIENNIPSYKFYGDYIFRLFVKNKDIFKARELFENIPYYDNELKE
jgi:hypothetical protein